MRLKDITITDHAIKQYLMRTRKMSPETLEDVFRKHKQGDRQASLILNKQKKELAIKFSRTILHELLYDDKEVRRETRVRMDRRCSFIAKKRGGKFTVITTYLQGPKSNFWKSGAAN